MTWEPKNKLDDEDVDVSDDDDKDRDDEKNGKSKNIEFVFTRNDSSLVELYPISSFTRIESLKLDVESAPLEALLLSLLLRERLDVESCVLAVRTFRGGTFSVGSANRGLDAHYTYSTHSTTWEV